MNGDEFDPTGTPEPALPTGAGTLPGISAPAPARPTRPTAQPDNTAGNVLQILGAGIRDMAPALSGQPPGRSVDAVLSNITAQRQFQLAQQKLDRQYALDVAKYERQATMDQINVSKNIMQSVVEFGKNSPQATEQEKSTFVDTQLALAKQAGVPYTRDQLLLPLRHAGMRDALGTFSDFLPEIPNGAHLLGVFNQMAARHEDDKAETTLRTAVAPVVQKALFPRLTPAVDYLRQAGNLSKDDPVPREDLANYLEASDPKRGKAFADLVRGVGIDPAYYKEHVVGLLAMPRLNVSVPGIERVAAEKRAETVATRLAATDPRVVKAEAEKADTLERAKTRARKEIEFSAEFLSAETRKAYQLARSAALGREAGTAEATGTSPALRALPKQFQTFFSGKGVTHPTGQQIAEAEVILTNKNQLDKIMSTVSGRAQSELNNREGFKKSGKPFKHDPLFENMSDADVRKRAMAASSVLEAIMRGAPTQ